MGGRIFSLELCRGIAALIVVFRHLFVHAFENIHHLAKIPFPSAIAVIFFFVLSGVVMTLAHPDRALSWRSVLKFMSKRALRIYPIYWIVLGYTAWFAPQFVHNSLLAQWILLLPNAQVDRSIEMNDLIPPAWTLHWEIFFYLIFAVSLLWGRRKWFFAIWMLLIIAFNSILPVSALPSFLVPFVAQITDPMCCYFIGGVGVALLVQKSCLPLRHAKYALLSGIALTCYVAWRGEIGLYLPTGLPDILIGTLGMGLILLALITLEHGGVLRSQRRRRR